MNRKIKYKINRISLFLLHTFFITQHLKYASEVWGGCPFADSEKLEYLVSTNICCYNSNRFINICPKILYIFRNTLKKNILKLPRSEI